MRRMVNPVLIRPAVARHCVDQVDTCEEPSAVAAANATRRVIARARG